MKNLLISSIGVTCLLLSTSLLAWIVPCDQTNLPRCEASCDNAGGAIIEDPKGDKWCQIPYQIATDLSGGPSPTDPRIRTLAEGGLLVDKIQPDDAIGIKPVERKRQPAKL